MTQRNFLTVLFVAIVTLLGFAGYYYLYQRQPISKDILKITIPITSFSGVIEKIDQNTLTIAHRLIPDLKYQVSITDTTIFTQPATSLRYLFKPNNSPIPLTTTSANLALGEFVTINTSIDLRTLRGNKFTADTIEITERLTAITGTITQALNNQIIVKSNLPTPLRNMTIDNPEPSNDQFFTITLTSDTEISRIVRDPAPRPLKMSFTSLQPGTQVTAYSDTDLSKTTTFEALRIEPIIIDPSPTATPIPTPIP